MNYELQTRSASKGLAQSKALGAPRIIGAPALLLATVFCVLTPAALRATTITGTVKDSQGNPVAGATVRLQLENCGAGGVCTLTGGGGIVSTLPVQTTTLSDGTFSIVVNGNDTITPAGTFYEVRYIASIGTIYSANYNVTGTTYNLNNQAPLGAMPPAPIAAAYTTVEQSGTTLQQRQLLNFTGSGISCVDNSGVSRTDCTVTSGGGSGTVTSVSLGLPSSVFGVSGSPVTTSGTLTGSFNTQNANLILGGPSSGAAAAPTFRALVGADLPNPSASALGGIESYTAVSHQWINQISTSGVPSSTQPAFSDLTGSLAIGQTPLTTQGDLLFANATPALARLAVGSNGQCLTSNGTTVSWGACASGSGLTLQTNGTNNSSQTALNLTNSAATNGLTLTHTNTSGGTVQLGLSGTLTVPGGGTGLATLTAHNLYVGNGTSSPNPVATGNAGQALISNGASSDPTFQDPIVSYAYANLLNAASATATQTSSLVRVSTFSGFGTLYVTYASITGSPAGCTLQLKNADSLGNLINNGAAISTTPSNGTTSSAVVSASGLQTEAQMEVVYACSTYPTAGTLSVDFSPGLAVGIVNTPTVTANAGTGTFTVSGTVTANQGGTWTVQPGNTANTTAWKVDGSAVTQPVSGTVTANAGTGTFTTNDTTLDLSQASTTSGEKGPLVQGAVTTSAPSYTTAQTDPLSLNTSGGLRVDGSGVTQPVSGTITANAGTGTLSTNVAQIAGTATSTSNGTSSAGDLRVNIASDNTAIANWGLGATGSAVPSGAQYVAGNGSGNLTGVVTCDHWTVINQASTTAATLITGVASKQTYICSINIVAAGANNVALVEGTGTGCATGTAGMAGGATAATGWNFAANGGLTMGTGVGAPFRTATAADNVCVLQSAATQVSGSVSWTQF